MARPHGMKETDLQEFVDKLARTNTRENGKMLNPFYTIRAKTVIVDLIRAMVERPGEFVEQFEALVCQQQNTQDIAAAAEIEAGWDASP